jgi:Protein of unknown function (DUF3467)
MAMPSKQASNRGKMAKKDRPAKRNGTNVNVATGAELVRANLNRVVETAPTFVSLYTNDTQVQTTPWDVRLVFGEIADTTNEAVIVRRTGEVRMSPQHAKRITVILIKQLQGYEAKFGPIPQPED